ncbi:MAG: hypothetical protein A2W28_00615 [Gammaproteobacteria bacterium RBG_16_51_14]|nr:MAG: hypothetical protein A2W28_00615 [Gammaproteobacteria bacterium RBG_16_51_14]
MPLLIQLVSGHGPVAFPPLTQARRQNHRFGPAHLIRAQTDRASQSLMAGSFSRSGPGEFAASAAVNFRGKALPEF